MHSLVVNGNVLDFKYKKIALGYTFYLGDIYVGQIFKMRKHEWSVVGKTPSNLTPVHGFGSRWHASEFLLKLEGFLKHD